MWPELRLRQSDAAPAAGSSVAPAKAGVVAAARHLSGDADSEVVELEDGRVLGSVRLETLVCHKGKAAVYEAFVVANGKGGGVYATITCPG